MEINDVRATVLEVIRAVGKSQKLNISELRDDLAIVDDLGFTSFSVASLIMRLEEVFGVDPFEDVNVMTTDMRTVGDVCRIYESAVEGCD